ncbi:type II toxin-antitoxin system RelE/ParE family toxin [Lacipirellula parvula]|uniref:Uncharacterized protein n=1 Tax=Lacipirellula parvula TaxID=2650471 RepID=A0A5K7XMY6_9BACT|nr:type II toxin-antitoxin system RelE/ParE family toxin [Lacipirellula parvula]BBO36083.1 hypothetical protein PLANPX_5695 [Lacipirellula parvula]
MATELYVKEIVYDDLEAACDWYERQRRGLSIYFMTRVNDCISRIVAAPNSFAIACGDYRRALVKRFPYAVFYQYDGREVTICAIFHTSRDSEAWQRRLST